MTRGHSSEVTDGLISEWRIYSSEDYAGRY
jgi:hypothetical protein